MSGENLAQAKNKEAVRRRMAELGYDNSKPYKNKKNHDGVKKIVKAVRIVVVVALVGGGVWLYLQNSQDQNTDSLASQNTTVSHDGEDIYALQSCLGSIDNSEIAIDDPDFWQKHINWYESTLSCYNEHPGAADSSEKSELEAKLAELREIVTSGSANDDATYRQNYADSEAAYQRKLAENQAEYERKKAELNAETQKKFEQYDRERAARDAEYEKQNAERAAQQAACDSFNSTYPDMNTYLSADAELARLEASLNAAREEYRHASSAWSGAIDYYSRRGGSTRDMDYWQQRTSEAQQAMNSANSAYNNRASYLRSQFTAARRAACGY